MFHPLVKNFTAICRVSIYPIRMTRDHLITVTRTLQLLQPKNPKPKKVFKGKVSKLPVKSELRVGEWGLRVMEPSRITAVQIDAMLVQFSRQLKSYKEKVRLMIFPHVPVTRKPSEIRMGKGKGAIKSFCARVRPNLIIAELSATIPEEVARVAIKNAGAVLPVKCVFARRQHTLPPSIQHRSMIDPADTLLPIIDLQEITGPIVVGYQSERFNVLADQLEKEATLLVA